jgi:hypothetical protein
MKNLKSLFYLLAVLPFCMCGQDTLDKVVKYKDAELKLPSSWEYNTQEIAHGLVYQILCFGDHGAFLFQWMESETELEEYFEVIKEPIKKMSHLQGAYFSNNQTGVFRGIKTIYSTFSGQKSRLKYSGTLIAFCNGGRTFLIMHQGDGKFYSSKLDEKIMAVIKAKGIPDIVNNVKTD